ncbi:hypothetical protein AAFF_G00365070, partial [Aldrovandia affinis]
TDQTLTSKTSTDQTLTSKTSTDQTLTSKTSTDETLTSKTSTDQTLTSKTSTDQTCTKILPHNSIDSSTSTVDSPAPAHVTMDTGRPESPPSPAGGRGCGRGCRRGLQHCLRRVCGAGLQCVEETPSVVFGLLLTMGFCIAIIIIFTITGRSVYVHVGSLAVVCVLLCVSAALLVALPWLPVVRRCGGSRTLRLGGTLHHRHRLHLLGGLCLGTVLPLTLSWALMVGIGTCVSHIIILSVYVPVTSPDSPDLAVQLVANAVLFVCVNCVGGFHRRLVERTHRRSQQNTESFSKLSLQRVIQKRKQEHLLLSVLPRYIALELKTEHLSDKKQSRERNFHNLYIRQHKDVSILYADIVGFTKLASSCTPEELVAVLNKLFGRFDDIAKAACGRTHRRSQQNTESFSKLSLQRVIQKRKQEHLLLSVLPRYIALELKTEHLSDKKQSRERNFHNLYIRQHKDVSILYADIVGFTKLASSCTPEELVAVLNKLFGRFDDIAKCVSGLPDRIPCHARNCVQMGLDMCTAINDLREATGVEISMRVGVHTGNVLCGGCTSQRKRCVTWAGGLRWRRGGGTRDSYLQGRNTYLIINPQTRGPGAPKPESLSTSGRKLRASVRMTQYLQSWQTINPFSNLSHAPHPEATPTATPAAPPTSTQHLSMGRPTPQTEHRSLNRRTSQVIDGSGIETLDTLDPGETKRSQRLDFVTLFFNEFSMEKKYRFSALEEKELCLSVGCLAVIFICVFTVHMLVSQKNTALGVSYGVTFPVIAVLLLVVFTGYLKRWRSKIPRGVQWVSSLSQAVSSRAALRLLLVFLSVLITLLMAILNFFFLPDPSCSGIPHNATVLESFNLYTVPYYLYTCLLAMLGVVVFVKICLEVKLFLATLAVVVYLALFLHVYAPRSDCYMLQLYSNGSQPAVLKEPKVMAGVWLFIFYFTVLILIRQDELACRVEFLLTQRFQKEREDMETMENINKLLLYNVLPEHVATHFMGKNHRNQDLYSTSCDCVCVMFASVPQFYKEFYNESNVNQDGLECLRALNEMIADFDELLSKPKFSCVEKIKTISSSYMAVSGLNQCYNRQDPKDSSMSYSHVRSMVDFAMAMMSSLENFNTHSFSNYKLRIGVNHGPVIAGVIGAHKPQYDIWGNTVNVASRMDSTGILDRIQVTEETAEVLKSLGYSLTLRGVITVKGKGELTTYFINTEN